MKTDLYISFDQQSDAEKVADDLVRQGANTNSVHLLVDIPHDPEPTRKATPIDVVEDLGMAPWLELNTAANITLNHSPGDRSLSSEVNTALGNTAAAASVAGKVTENLVDHGVDRAFAVRATDRVKHHGALLTATLPSGQMELDHAMEIVARDSSSHYETWTSGWKSNLSGEETQ